MGIGYIKNAIKKSIIQKEEILIPLVSNNHLL